MRTTPSIVAFTDDGERLKQIVSGVKLAPRMTDSNGLAVDGLSRAAASYSTRNSILALKSLVKNLSGVPGRKSLVLFSGGQDSTTCLARALQRYARVETIGFDYGQRHAIELTVRPTVLAGLRALSPEWDARLGEDHMIDLSLIAKISDTAPLSIGFRSLMSGAEAAIETM